MKLIGADVVELAPFTGGGSTVTETMGAFDASSIITTSTNEHLDGWLATSSTAAEARLGTDTDTECQEMCTRMTTTVLVAAVEEWNAAKYQRVLEAASNAGVSREELDSLISDDDSTPCITGKKPE